MNTVSYIANSQTAPPSAELGTAQLQLVLGLFEATHRGLNTI